MNAYHKKIFIDENFSRKHWKNIVVWMFVKNHTKKLTGKNVKKEKPKEKVTGKTCHGKKLQA